LYVAATNPVGSADKNNSQSAEIHFSQDKNTIDHAVTIDEKDKEFHPYTFTLDNYTTRQVIGNQELTFGSRLIETQDKYPRYKK
jgi:hypothetical protein